MYKEMKSLLEVILAEPAKVVWGTLGLRADGTSGWVLSPVMAWPQFPLLSSGGLALERWQLFSPVGGQAGGPKAGCGCKRWVMGHRAGCSRPHWGFRNTLEPPLPSVTANYNQRALAQASTPGVARRGPQGGPV